VTQEETPQLARNDELHRYELRLDGQVVAFAEFRVRPSYLVFTHTETDPFFEGRGFASALARGLLDDVRARGEKLKSVCPFISAYLKRHPEYEDLVVGEPDDAD
jgi:predicted GNAT family acetyltransferase